MRTVKWSAFLSGLCVVAVALGMFTASARADITTERGASILAFPKVLADGTADTIIQIANTSNNMVHARCFYVNAQLLRPALPEDPVFNPRQWFEIDFVIWLTKQQPTSWQVSTGRFINPSDGCFSGNTIDPTQCKDAGIDPGAIPPVPADFVGELKCIEVDMSDNPIGGNHLKGEATIKYGPDVAKYNAIGIEGTERAGETGNELRLDQPADTEDPVGQYNACPNVLIINHLAEGKIDPVIADQGFGGSCQPNPAVAPAEAEPVRPNRCETDADCCGEGEIPPCMRICENGSSIIVDPLTSRVASLTSATLTDVTLIPCTQDFEEQIPGRVKIQIEVFNEFEQFFSASTTVECWQNFRLFELQSPNNPELSPFHFANLGTEVAQTRLIPAEGNGAVIGVIGVLRADAQSRLTRVLLNTFNEGDRLTATEGEIVDVITLAGP